ncbi:hypothetical protein AJ88_22195 [Mesorhizobium amorphae CCBAU 01583]|nr:hypothetical protein AJ88_22195 [Mesorhizobium amorphae CCBAU 01583]
MADMSCFRMKMIAAGYQDGNDANRLRSDPVFKMAQGVLPSGRDLASRSTMCRLENLPGVRVAMGRAMVDLYCASFRQVPKRIVLDKHLRSPCPFRLNIGSRPLQTSVLGSWSARGWSEADTKRVALAQLLQPMVQIDFAKQFIFRSTHLPSDTPSKIRALISSIISQFAAFLPS